MKKLLVMLAMLPVAALARFDGDGDGGFGLPAVDFQNRAEGTVGWTIYDRLVPDPEAFIRQHAKAVVEVLYFSDTDANIPDVERIYYVFTPDVAISDKGGVHGRPKAFRIRYAPSNVEKWYGAGGEKALLEIGGVLNHELTHVYQLTPAGAGDYSRGTEYWAFIEGMADAVRPVLGPFADDRQPNRGGTWLSGYSTTGFFLKWLKDSKDADFLRKFNRTAKEINPWSWDKAMQKIFGTTVTTQSLWDEYQASLAG